MLFPIISASDDLHAVGQAMEESKRNFLNGAHAADAAQSLHYASLALPVSGGLTVAFERVGTILVLSPGSRISPLASAFAGRSPPLSSVAL
jgi:hypothetical protein